MPDAVDLGEVHVGKEQLLVIGGGVRAPGAEGVHEEAMAPEPDLPFLTDAVHGGHEDAVGHGVAALDDLPGVALLLDGGLVEVFVVADGGRVEQDLGAAQRRETGGFGEPLVPADEDADAPVLRVEDGEPQVAGREVEFLVEFGVVGDVHLAVVAGDLAVGVEHEGAVVVDAAGAFLEDGDDDDDLVLLGQRGHALGRGARGGGFGQLEVLDVLGLGEIQAPIELGQADDVGALLDCVGDALLGLGDVGLGIRRHGHLDEGDADRGLAVAGFSHSGRGHGPSANKRVVDSLGKGIRAMAPWAGVANSPFRADVFTGHHAFVTGGSQGIGLGVAEAFGRHGARVTIASRKEENLRAARDQLANVGIKANTLALDVRDRPAVQAAAEALAGAGDADILINNAAGNFAVPFLEMSENAWDTVLNIVLQGTANVSRAFGKEWVRKKRPAAVVNVLAGYAWTGAPYLSHSGAAKAAVMNLTRSLAVEWAGHGIRVNSVSPGAIADTGGSKILLEGPGLLQPALARIPAARLGTREELANAILFLASDAASYVTGSVLVVDGGMDANSWNILPTRPA